VRLDDFYRDEDDAAMPRSESLGIVDWDHPDSWNRQAAVDALATLIAQGRVETPVYDISRSRAVGTTEVTARPDDLVLAEGIFAAEIIGDLRERGLLAKAYCVHHHRFVTFVWRLLRDLSERRKPPWTLVRRGLALMRDEPRVVARQEALGAVPARAKDVEPQLSALAR
jgi:uridine kinase